MATQYTQGKWFIDKESNDQLWITTEKSPTTICMISQAEYSDGEIITTDEDTANAALICDAVNNTAGKGINPNAVPGLLQVLDIISQHAYDDDTPLGDILADFDNMRGLAINAIKSAELK